MQLKDIANMEKYLQEDCYCPGEIYDMSGLFFQVFKADEECRLLVNGKTKTKDQTITCVLCRDQILNFWIDSDNKIVSAERYDSTENNIKEIVNLLTGKIKRVVLDEFEEGDTAKSLADIIKYADAIYVS